MSTNREARDPTRHGKSRERIVTGTGFDAAHKCSGMPVMARWRRCRRSCVPFVHRSPRPRLPYRRRNQYAAHRRTGRYQVSGTSPIRHDGSVKYDRIVRCRVVRNEVARQQCHHLCHGSGKRVAQNLAGNGTVRHPTGLRGNSEYSIYSICILS